MTRPSDPPGVTYEGEADQYDVLLHGDRIGFVYRTQPRHGTWTAFPYSAPNGPRWSGVNRGEAVTPLIAWHQAGRP